MSHYARQIEDLLNTALGKHGLTQAFVAESIGTTRQNVNYFFKGKRLIPRHHLAPLYRIMPFDIDKYCSIWSEQKGKKLLESYKRAIKV